MIGRKTLGLFTLAAIAAVAASACGGDDDGGVAFTPGTVVCDALANTSYRYNASVHFVVDAAPTPTPEGVVPGPGAADIAQVILGAVEDADSYQAEMTFNQAGASAPTTTGAIHDDGKAWLQSGGRWTPQVTEGSSRPVELIPYLPKTLCAALAPDVDAMAPDHASEDVNGVPSQRFDYALLTSDFPDRSPDFGGSSDVGSMINVFSGSVWVANDGNFISKMQMSGQGRYADGSVLHFEISYEVSDWGSDVKVEPPL